MSRETSSESVARHLGESVQGESVEIGEDGEELGMFTDLDMVSKVYKLDGLGSAGAGAKEGAVNSASKQVDKRREMEGVVLGIMTIKGS
jgi:EKC/KEOPS complex subunit CGI121/TPRKB